MKIRDLKKTQKRALMLGAALMLGGCGLDVPDLNRPSVESLENTPTRSAVLSATVGLEVGSRAGIASQNGYVSILGVLGRESYVLDTADPRYVGELLAGDELDSGSPAFGGNFWTAPYANIRNANTLLNALDKVSGVTDEEKEAIRGFAQTLQALDFLVVINTRDTNGAPIDVNRPLGSPLAPIETKDVVFQHIAELLDGAQGHLTMGGSQFPFTLSSGFHSYTDASKQMSVAEFIKFNRALKARVDVYRKDWGQALTDLGASFLTPIDTTAPDASVKSLNVGAYYAYGTGSGDTSDDLRDTDIYVHPSIRKEAENQANGQADARVQRKITVADKPRSWQGITATDAFTLYPTATTPVPIIRNEELYLLRAEASLNTGNEAQALADLNAIRHASGGLADLPAGLTGDSLVNAMLKERRYSLLFEGGHRWIDARRYGKLGDLPLDLPSHTVHPNFPIPLPETDARK